MEACFVFTKLSCILLHFATWINLDCLNYRMTFHLVTFANTTDFVCGSQILGSQKHSGPWTCITEWKFALAFQRDRSALVAYDLNIHQGWNGQPSPEMVKPHFFSIKYVLHVIHIWIIITCDIKEFNLG